MAQPTNTKKSAQQFAKLRRITYLANKITIPRADLYPRLALALSLAFTLAITIAIWQLRQLRLAQDARDLPLVDPRATKRRLGELGKARRAFALALALETECMGEIVHRLAHFPRHRRERERRSAVEVRYEVSYVLGDCLEADRRPQYSCRRLSGFACLFAFLFLSGRE